ncbi:saccharopine dehydrogenase [Pyrenochaeta sp. DS3sAY3a]|nr:saccharopine dehydrogenase [Pyrenochaeta sp. DS3sAY3a]
MSLAKKVLVLGAGSISSQVVEYLVRDAQTRITVACRTLSSATAVASKFPRVTALALDATSAELNDHVAAHDVVVSLIPPVYHPAIAKAAIKAKKNFICTSYTTPEMLKLGFDATQAGVTLMTEVGVAPGLDHVYTVKTIGDVHSSGGKISSFTSFVGGLPALECSDNPLRMKFSWNPKNTILSQMKPASFLEDGHLIEVAGKDLMDSAKPIALSNNSRYDFMCFGTGSSVPLREHYNIPEASTIIRGTLRYKENPIMISTLMKLGWLDASEQGWLRAEVSLTWAKVTQHLLGADDSDEDTLVNMIKQRIRFRSDEQGEQVIHGLRWIGIFSADQVPPRTSILVDLLSSRLEELCSWHPGERDLLFLQICFVIDLANGKRKRKTATLELLGDPDGYSAMARSTGTVCGIAVQLMLEAHEPILKPGILRPYAPELCALMLVRLKEENLLPVELDTDAYPYSLSSV